MAKILECWNCGRERECRSRMRPDGTIEYLCKDCANGVDTGKDPR